MSDEWSRRSVLKSSLGVPLAGVALNYITEDVTAADGDSTLPDNEYAALRERWADLLTGGSIDETKPEYDGVLAKLDRDAQNYQDTMEADPTDRLWSALPIPSDSSSSYDEGHLTDSYGRLLTMAKAYQTEGCALKGDSSIASDIVTGLEFLYNRLYNEDQSQFGNWWHWEIGAPMRLMGICTLLSADLTSIQLTNYTDAVETHVGSPYEYTFYDHTSGGSNRVDESVITALRGILTETDSTIKLARDCVEDSDIFQYTTASSGNGLYPDGSYVYHKEIPYIGSYGAVLFTGLSELFTILDGSSWEITGVDRDVIYDAVDDAISPFMFKGLMMGSVSGRAISREDQSDHVRGHAVTGTVLQMANTASEPYATEFEELAKGWIENDTWDSFMSDAEVADIANAEAVLEDDSITAASEPIQSQVFHNMDRAVHNRSDWAFVISMCSERIARYQAINEENLQGWYTGAGMTQLYDDDLGHYTDGYWPTVDPYRLPGTTVDTSERTDLSGTHHPLPPTQWVGGATVDEEFSMVGMEFEAEKAPLTGKKSWLALDDMIVGLGSDITLVEENRIEDNPPGENPDATQIPSTADTFVRDGDSSGDNYSSWGLMVTKNDVEGYNRESFLKFDLSSLSESVEEAKLHLHGRVKTDEGATSGDVSISEVTDDSWSGGELTWDTKPGIESEIGTMTLTGTKQWYEIDVTEFIKSQASGDGTASFAIQQLGNLRSEFDSPDGSSNAPQLSIVTSGDGETSDGETPSEENSDATDIQSAAGTFVRDGDSSGDSYGWGVIVVKNDDVGYNRESFVKFDLSSLSEPVEQATLRLYGQVNTDGDVTSSEVSVSEVTDDSWTGSELTWDTKPEIGSEIGTMTVGETSQWYTVDVTAFAKSQASGDGTASLAIQQISGPRTEFDSPTGGDNPPQLSVVTSGDSTTSNGESSGDGETSPSGGPTVETTVENRNLHTNGDEVLTVDDTAKSTTPDWSETLSKVSWAHLDGTGGYLFPNEPTIEAKRENRTGSWRDINAEGSTDDITREYQTLWFDHGTDPSGATYAYAVLPGLTAAETKQRSQNPEYEIIANNETVQAVTVSRLGLTAANFWSSGSITIPGIDRTLSVDSPASVILRHRNDELVISVADPSRTQETVTVEYDYTTYGTVSTDSTISVSQYQPTVVIDVAVDETRGKTHSATFDLPSTSTLMSTAGTFVRDGDSSGDSYGWGVMVVKNDDVGYNRESFVKFDLSSLSGSVEQATLRLYGQIKTDGDATSGDVSISEVTDDSWTGSDLTWDTKPEIGSEIGTMTVGETEQWYTIDVTAFAKSQASGDGTASLAIQQLGDVRTEFDSPTGGDNPPQLSVVTSGDSTTSTPTIETTTHTQSIDLSWDEMSGTVAEYDVYLDGASQPTQTVTGLSTTVSDLDPATTYDVSVIAVRSDEESTVATTTVTTDALSMFEAIDTNGNGEIDDTELLEASDHWRTGTPVDSAGGETVDDLDLLEMADQWRNS